MSKFRKSNIPEVPPLNTASLPDLIFTLLFFFMIVTNMKDDAPKVDFKEPHATEYRQLEEKNLNTFIYVGKPKPEFRKEMGAGPTIQVENHWMTVAEISLYFSRKKAYLSPAEQERMTVSIRADKGTKMEIISEIEEALRKAGVLKVNYGVEEGIEN